MSDTTNQAPRSLDEMRGPQQPGAEAPRRPTSQRRGYDAPIAPEANLPQIRIGFGDLQSWEFTQRIANGFASSTLVPEAYRRWVPKGKYGKARLELIENPSAIPNCIIALNMAERLNADALMVMQNLHIIDGRPSWSAQFVIAVINACGRFSPLEYEVTGSGEGKSVNYVVSQWNDAISEMEEIKKVALVPDLTCIAFCTEKASGKVLRSAPVSMEMAVLEGWYDRKGSKWKTPLRDQMMRYRAASFFGRIYAPELLMGLRTVEEESEIIDAEFDAHENAFRMAQTHEARQADAVAAANSAPASQAQIGHEETIRFDLGTNDRAPELVEAKTAEQEAPAKAATADPVSGGDKATAEKQGAAPKPTEAKDAQQQSEAKAQTVSAAQRKLEQALKSAPKSAAARTAPAEQLDLGGDPGPTRGPEHDEPADDGFGSGE